MRYGGLLPVAIVGGCVVPPAGSRTTPIGGVSTRDSTEAPTGDTGPTSSTPESVTVSAGFGWTRVDAGPAVSCGVRASGEVACWGDPASPVLAGMPGGSIVELSVGDAHACAISTLGELACWGDDPDGRATPPPGNDWAHVSAGGRHSCGLRIDGTASCWGDDGSGQLQLPAETWRQISAGYEHTCGIVARNDEVVCVGRDTAGEVADVDRIDAVAVAAGRAVTCAVTTNDSWTRCVGDAAHLGMIDDYFGNVALDIGGDFVAVLTDFGSATLLHGAGHVPWDDDPGPVGEDWWDTQLPGRYSWIGAGARHLCAVAPADQALLCVGRDDLGQVTLPP